jgi:hypothetical protein
MVKGVETLNAKAHDAVGRNRVPVGKEPDTTCIVVL